MSVGENDEKFFEKYALSQDIFAIHHFMAFNCPIIRIAITYLTMVLGVFCNKITKIGLDFIRRFLVYYSA